MIGRTVPYPLPPNCLPSNLHDKWLFHLTWQRGFADGVDVKDLMGCTLDCLGGSNWIRASLKSSDSFPAVVKERYNEVRSYIWNITGFADEERKPQAKECKQPLEIGKDKEKGSPWSLQERTQRCQIPWFSPVRSVELLTFRTVPKYFLRC